jgi:H+/Cl- antiporter ClcA
MFVGLFSALAAAFLKNAIHFTNQLLTGWYMLLIPLIITSTVAYITTRSFEKHSIYHVQLAERGELVTDQHTGICLLSFHRSRTKYEYEREIVF